MTRIVMKGSCKKDSKEPLIGILRQSPRWVEQLRGDRVSRLISSTSGRMGISLWREEFPVGASCRTQIPIQGFSERARSCDWSEYHPLSWWRSPGGDVPLSRRRGSPWDEEPLSRWRGLPGGDAPPRKHTPLWVDTLLKRRQSRDRSTSEKATVCTVRRRGSPLGEGVLR